MAKNISHKGAKTPRKTKENYKNKPYQGKKYTLARK